MAVPAHQDAAVLQPISEFQDGGGEGCEAGPGEGRLSRGHGGISLPGDILDTATDIGIIEKAGSWYSYNGERIGQGRENVKAYLEEHPDVLEDVRARVMKHFEDSKQPADAKDGGIRVDEDGVVIE